MGERIRHQIREKQIEYPPDKVHVGDSVWLRGNTFRVTISDFFNRPCMIYAKID